MIHHKCGGTILPEIAKRGTVVTNSTSGGSMVLAERETPIEIGRCQKCRRAGYVCDLPEQKETT